MPLCHSPPISLSYPSQVGTYYGAITLFTTMLEIPTYFLNLCRKHQHKTHFSDTRFQHTSPNTSSPQFHDHPVFPTYFLNLCWNFQHKTYFSDALFQHTILQTKKRCFRTPSHLLIFYLLIPATFCCTHSPILFKNCSNIFIPLMVTCLMKSYALLSFSLSVWFSAFNS